MAKHPIPKLRLEPGAFRRHDSPGIGDGHEVLDTRGEQRKRAGILAGVHNFFQLSCAANPANETEPLAGARVIDSEEWFEDILLQQCDVKLLDRISRRGETRTKMQRVPAAGQEKPEFMLAAWLAVALGFNDEDAIELF